MTTWIDFFYPIIFAPLFDKLKDTRTHLLGMSLQSMPAECHSQIVRCHPNSVLAIENSTQPSERLFFLLFFFFCFWKEKICLNMSSANDVSLCRALKIDQKQHPPHICVARSSILPIYSHQNLNLFFFLFFCDNKGREIRIGRCILSSFSRPSPPVEMAASLEPALVLSKVWRGRMPAEAWTSSIPPTVPRNGSQCWEMLCTTTTAFLKKKIWTQSASQISK